MGLGDLENTRLVRWHWLSKDVQVEIQQQQQTPTHTDTLSSTPTHTIMKLLLHYEK